MTRARAVPILAFVAVALAVVGALAWPSHSSPSSSKVRSTITVTSTQTLGNGATLAPATPEQVASIQFTATQAAAVADYQATKPWVTSATPELGVFTAAPNFKLPGYSNVVAWVIHLTGCFALPGPSPLPGVAPNTPSCSPTADIVIDASTGQELMEIGTV